MTLPDPIPTTLSDHLRQLGLTQTAMDVNDFIARATQKRWSPVVLLDTLVRAELDARARQRVERRLKEARVGRFKSIAAEALEAAHEQGIRRFQGFRDLPRGREGLIERHPGPAEAGHYRFDNTRSGSVRL